jgi:hypothetical protein
MLRRLGLEGTELAKAQCSTIRLKLLKIGAVIRITMRKVWISGSEQEFVNMCAFVGFLSDSLLGPPMPLHLVHVRCHQCFPAFCGSFASDFGRKSFRGTIPGKVG